MLIYFNLLFWFFTVFVFANVQYDENSFDNIAGKGQNAVCQHFVLFQQCFTQRQTSLIEQHLTYS